MMSDIMEKTIASLPSLISGSLSGKQKANSRAFQSFIKGLGNLKSKYEEEQFIKRELSVQKQKLIQPGISTSQVREYLVRLVYCSMLGYDVSFAYIHAIKLAQQGTLLDKRAGYLVSAIFLHDGHELVMLLVNTIQKDLRSSNIAEVCMALTGAGKLISQEMIPGLLPLVEEKLKHPREIVRKKAVLCMHAFHIKAPDLLARAHHHLRAALCDRDPGVMWAALHFYYHLMKTDATTYRDLVPSLVGLLDQVISRHLPAEFEYHSVPAPWLQILLLKMLAKLGMANQSTSELMYPVLGEVLQRTEPSHKIGLAVIYECLETILSIWPHAALVEHAAKCVGKFLSSKGNNLRYLGVKALTLVVQVNPSYAVEHQEAVLDSLEHPDLTIRTKTLELLYQMANPQNRRVIVERLLHHLTSTTDVHIKVDVITKVTQLAEKFDEDRTWFIETVNRALVLGGEGAVPPGISHKVLAILPPGHNKNDGNEDDAVFRKFAVRTYWTILHQDDVPQALIQIAAWVLGEYAGESGDIDLKVLIQHLKAVYMRSSSSRVTRAWILSGLIKLGSFVQLPLEALETFKSSIEPQDSDLRQRLEELVRITSIEECKGETLKNLRMNMSREKDWSLSFVDGYVADCLEEFGQPYKSYTLRHSQPQSKDSGSLFAGLNFTPYESPKIGHSGGSAGTEVRGVGSRDPEADNSLPGSCSSDDFAKPADSLQMSGVQRVWDRTGVVKAPDWREVAVPSSVNNEKQDHPETKAQEKSDDAEAWEQEALRKRQQLATQLFSGIAPPLIKGSQDSKDIQIDPDERQPPRPKEPWTTDMQPTHLSQEKSASDVRPKIEGDAVNQISDLSLFPPEELKNNQARQIWSKDMLGAERLESPSEGEAIAGDPCRSSGTESPDGKGPPVISKPSSASSSSESQSSTITKSTAESMYCDQDNTSLPNSSGSSESHGSPEKGTSSKGSRFDGVDMAEYVEVMNEDAGSQSPPQVKCPGEDAREYDTVSTPAGAGISLLSAADMLSPEELPVKGLGCDPHGDSNDFVKVDLLESLGPSGNMSIQMYSSTPDDGANVQVPKVNTNVPDDLSVDNRDIDNTDKDPMGPGSAGVGSDILRTGSDEKIGSSVEKDPQMTSPEESMAGGTRQDDELSVDSLERERPDQEEDLNLEATDFELDLLPKYLYKYPHEATARIAGANNTLIVLSQKAWLPETLVLIIAGVFTGPPTEGAQLKMDIDIEAATEQGLSVMVTSTAMDQSEETSALPTGCCYLVVEVTSEVLPRCPAEVRLRVERRWESDTPQAALQVHLPLALTDFLRPAQLSVEEFESIWTELPTQQDSQLTPASPYTSSLDTLTHFLTASLRFSSIRVLGTEVLGAGQFQGSPSRVCLVRALWNPSTNSVITMKARDPQLLNDLFCFLNTLNT